MKNKISGSFLLALVLLQSCSINNFVAKNKQVDLLPEFIPVDSTSLISPAFSGYSIAGNKIEWNFPISVSKQNIFKKQLVHLLDSQEIKIKDIFSISGECLTNKINAENWREEKWDSVNSYHCLQNDYRMYTVFLYNMFETRELSGHSTIPQNLRSEIHSIIRVFYQNRIVYSRNFRHSIKLTNKEQKAFETTNAYPFFHDDQIKHVVFKITEDLFKRIKTK